MDQIVATELTGKELNVRFLYQRRDFITKVNKYFYIDIIDTLCKKKVPKLSALFSKAKASNL